jgi:hypothetical protein
MTELQRAYAEFRAAVILAGKETRKPDFGRADSPVLGVLRRILRDSRVVARKEGITVCVRLDVKTPEMGPQWAGAETSRSCAPSQRPDAASSSRYPEISLASKQHRSCCQDGVHSTVWEHGTADRCAGDCNGIAET